MRQVRYLRGGLALLLATGVCGGLSAAGLIQANGGRQYQIQDLGSFDGEAVGQAEPGRAPSRLIGGTPANAGSLSYFDRDRAFNGNTVPVSELRDWVRSGLGTSDDARGSVNPKNAEWGRRAVIALDGELERPKGAVRVTPQAANERNQIVGNATRADGTTFPVLWDSRGRATVLSGFEKRSGKASAINNGGEVVGTLSAPNGQEQAFHWQNGRLTNLNRALPQGSGWNLVQALGVSDQGAVVGWGVRDGQKRAFLLTPQESATRSARRP